MIDIGKYNKDQGQYGKLVRELYERYPQGVTLSPEYAEFVQENQMQFLIRLARYKFVARLLKKKDHVLEVGSGSGLGTLFLGQHCAQATGLELKTTETEEAQTLNQRANVQFIAGDLFDWKPSPQYDVVVSLDVIEHMPKEKGKALLAAMASQLKPSGMLVVGSPSIYSYQYQSALSQASHVKCYDLPELLDMVDIYFQRSISFSMNDEMVHTGHYKMAWYYFALAFMPKPANPSTQT